MQVFAKLCHWSAPLPRCRLRLLNASIVPPIGPFGGAGRTIPLNCYCLPGKAGGFPLLVKTYGTFRIIFGPRNCVNETGNLFHILIAILYFGFFGVKSGSIVPFLNQ